MTTQVLIIEDDAILREMIRRRLVRFGYECTTTVDGESGIESALVAPPRIILLDMTLPGKDGESVAREMKNSERLKQIPVIAITARAMVGDREKFLASGCDDYVSKPIDFDLLDNKMQALLRHEA